MASPSTSESSTRISISAKAARTAAARALNGSTPRDGVGPLRSRTSSARSSVGWTSNATICSGEALATALGGAEARSATRRASGTLGNEGALVAVLDVDLSLEATILAEPHAPGSGNLVELPGALPRQA